MRNVHLWLDHSVENLGCRWSKHTCWRSFHTFRHGGPVEETENTTEHKCDLPCKSFLGPSFPRKISELIHSRTTDSSHFCPAFSQVVHQELSKQRRAVDGLDNMIGGMGKSRLRLGEASTWTPGGHTVGRDWRQRLGSCR